MWTLWFWNHGSVKSTCFAWNNCKTFKTESWAWTNCLMCNETVRLRVDLLAAFCTPPSIQCSRVQQVHGLRLSQGPSGWNILSSCIGSCMHVHSAVVALSTNETLTFNLCFEKGQLWCRELLWDMLGKHEENVCVLCRCQTVAGRCVERGLEPQEEKTYYGRINSMLMFFLHLAPTLFRSSDAPQNHWSFSKGHFNGNYL